MQDIAHALRRLGHSPGFAATAILTLALGIGANSAIFSVVYGVLLKPLPYPDPDRLVRVYQVYEGENSVFSPPNFLDAQRLSRTLDSIAAIDSTGVTVTQNGESERVDAAEISASFFDVFRTQPDLGRRFRVEDHEEGRHRVVILGHGFWVQRFGGNPAAVGSRLSIEGEPYEIVGVMPSGFAYPDEARVWMPLLYDQDFKVTNRGGWYLTAVGRLKPGVSAAAATSELKAIASRLEKQYPEHNTKVTMAAVPLQETVVQPVRPALTVLLGAVGAVLLIACVNVANLLLARGAGRSTELAVRTALGASRARLVRQLFIESVVLAAAGGFAGLLLSAWLTDLVVATRPDGLPRLDDIGVNRVVTAFTAALAALTAVVFGLVPAFQITRGNLAGAIKESGRSSEASTGRDRMRRLLVVSEVALALTLLVGAALLIRSFANLVSVDPGFRAGDALTFRLALPAQGTEDDERIAVAMRRATESIRAVPGVIDAGASIGLPLTGTSLTFSFNVRGRPPRQPGDASSLETRVVTPEYFRAIGLPLRRGRALTQDDDTSAEKVVVISEAAVRRYFSDEEPLGKYIELGWRRSVAGERVGGRVVGIVGDAKEHGLTEEEPPEIYVPHAQAPVRTMQFIVRTGVPPGTVADSIIAKLRELDPRAPVYRVRTLDEILSAAVAEPRFYMLLLAGFAALALILATVGVFGVMSYSVAQRTREIGIRMALGAAPATVVRMVLRQAIGVIGAGIGLGIGLALALSRSMQKLLFDLSPTDPATIAGVALLLALVALIAGYLPARRATRLDPVRALRAE